MANDIEFIDCSSISVSYDATGKANVSFTVVKNNQLPIDVQSYKSVCFGFVKFTGSLMSVIQKPVNGSYNEATGEMWVDWQMTLQGVGNRSLTSPSSWGVC